LGQKIQFHLSVFAFTSRIICSWLKLSIQFRQNNNHKQQELKDQHTSKLNHPSYRVYTQTPRRVSSHKSCQRLYQDSCLNNSTIWEKSKEKNTPRKSTISRPVLELSFKSLSNGVLPLLSCFRSILQSVERCSRWRGVNIS
jgi:hypothetical protein